LWEVNLEEIRIGPFLDISIIGVEGDNFLKKNIGLFPWYYRMCLLDIKVAH
jgi:hypothetical protein